MRIRPYIFLLIVFTTTTAHADWKVDFSRRESEIKKVLVPSDESNRKGDDSGFFKGLFDSSEPLQEIVVLNTTNGFVPATVRVRQNGNYRIHVVNVNEREKNVSFVMDAFSEHHATYFGKIKSFDIRPQKDGVFRFVSPETSAQGRLVVYPANEINPGVSPSPSLRTPAAEE